MLLKCIAITGASLGPHRRGPYYFQETKYDLTIGKHYEAYAIIMINCGLAVLVTDDDDDPFWYPLQAFTIEDGAVPKSWAFRFFPDVEPGGMPGEYQAQAIWGYSEMVYSDEHNDMLMDRAPEAREAFYAARDRQDRGS